MWLREEERETESVYKSRRGKKKYYNPRQFLVYQNEKGYNVGSNSSPFALYALYKYIFFRGVEIYSPVGYCGVTPCH